jgi:hypothetical protein
MKKILFLTALQIIFTGFAVMGQKIVLDDGSLDFLKGQQKLLVKYDYSNLSVGKYDKEADYINDKVAEYNKDEAGKGDKWKESWLSDRPSRFEPKFEELFNTTGDSKIGCSQDSDAKYEMLVHTTFVEPGFNIGITRKNAYINTEIVFKEAATGKEVATILVSNCPGRDAMGFDFDTGYRIEEAYAMLGKSLARYLLKAL